jgi:hypothetical protein
MVGGNGLALSVLVAESFVSIMGCNPDLLMPINRMPSGSNAARHASKKIAAKRLGFLEGVPVSRFANST